LKEVWSSEGWGRNFEDGFKWKVGNGKDIYFWKDSWLNGESLKNAFPRLFSTSSTKDAKLAELGFWSNGVSVWQLAWRRPFFEWEKSLVQVKAWSWVSLNFRSASFSFSDWCLKPLLCMRLIT